jgi:hypothetical protein
MKIYIHGWFHHKNLESLNRIIRNNGWIKTSLNDAQIIFDPECKLDPKQHQTKFFIIGPHFNIPKINLNKLSECSNYVIIQPSDWVIRLFKIYHPCISDKLCSIPFCVNTEKFKPLKPLIERNGVIVYFKRRKRSDLNIILDKLRSDNIQYTLLEYGSYKEDNFLRLLRDTKYVIWVGCHESQGFALEETLACDVPVLVWNVKKVSDETNSYWEKNKINQPATSVPYWSNECGEVFSDFEDFQDTYTKFLNKISEYRPREYIIGNLNTEVCAEKILNIFDSSCI